MLERYEVMLVVKPLLAEDIKDKVVKKIEKMTKQLGGSVEVKELMGKKLLAYPIDKYKEGYYVLSRLELPTEKMSEFKRGLKLMDETLRFIVIKEDQL